MWLYKDQDENRFFNDLRLNQLQDGLLCTTIIEDRLTDAIKVRWHDVKTDGGLLSDRMFSYQGPAGSLGSKIDIGFAIGLYTEQTFKDLHTIRKIRNAFAHEIAPKDFDAQHIKDLAANIKLPEKHPIEVSSKTGPAIIGTDSINPLDQMKTMLKHSSVDDISSARNRFVRATELLNGFLFVLQMDAYAKKTTTEF